MYRRYINKFIYLSIYHISLNLRRRVSENKHKVNSRPTTKLSCLCRVRFGGVNWISYKSRLLPTEKLKSEHVQSNHTIHTKHDTDTTVLSWLVWRCELSRPNRPTSAFSVRVSGGAVRPVRPPDALRRRTHLSGGEFRHTRQAMGRQLRA